ncbi:hypothetical protein PROP_02659 [Propionicimonas sp. T2.31MG-18]|uniref:hypothetical protein n=1 Tax=Propionicimonas sp. T2.31MG-18 TaxID=3157620 RepID=UPI0035E63849
MREGTKAPDHSLAQHVSTHGGEGGTEPPDNLIHNPVFCRLSHHSIVGLHQCLVKVLATVDRPQVFILASHCRNGTVTRVDHRRDRN